MQDIEKEKIDGQPMSEDYGKGLKANQDNLLVVEPNRIAECSTATGLTNGVEGKICVQIDNFDQCWDAVWKAILEHIQTLRSTHEVQCYHRDADQVKDKIIEKESTLNSKNFDHDLMTIQCLRNERLVKEIDVIKEEVKDLDKKAQHLMLTYPDQAQGISKHQAEINNWCKVLINKANQRSFDLLDYCDLQHFLTNFRDLTAWIDLMMASVSLDELAKDVAGTKVLLERHKKDRRHIKAHPEIFQSFEMFGQRLLQNHHYASDEVHNKLNEVAKARLNLKKAWVERRAKLDQCMELQLFNLDCEQAEMWMDSCETCLKDRTGGAGNNVEALLKKQEEYYRAIDSKEEKIANLKLCADGLIQRNHYDSPGIVRRRDEVLERWHKVKDALVDNRAKLLEDQLIQQYIDCGFFRCDIVLGPPNADTKKSRKVSLRHSTKYASVASASSADEVSSGCCCPIFRKLFSFKQRKNRILPQC